MKINVIKVGNSKGIRLPKAIIDEYQIEDVLEIKLKENHLEIRPLSNPRKNWEAEFEKMAIDENEETLIPDFFKDEEL